MKMKSHRKAQRDRDKRAAAVATRRIAPGNDNESTHDELDDIDLQLAVTRSLQGYDE